MNFRIASFAVAAFLLAAPAANANLIVNGDFETGDFTGWTTDQVSYPEYIVTDPAHGGLYSAQIAGYSYGPDTLGQTIADTVGQRYTLTFWLYNQFFGDIVFTDVLWNGNTVRSLGSTANNAWAEFSVTVFGTGSDTLVFSSANDPGWNYIDDISLNASRAIPEPGTLALLGASLLALGGLGLRKKFG